MLKDLRNNTPISLPYRFKLDKAELFYLLLPGIPCAGLAVWLAVERVWQGLLIFLPLSFGIGFLFLIYASRSIILQEDRMQMKGILLKKHEILYSDIKSVDIIVMNKARFMVVILKSSIVKLNLTPFDVKEWRKLMQVLTINAPDVVIEAVAARLLKGEFYY